MIKIAGKIAASAAALLFLMWILLQTAPVQTFVARQVTDALEKSIDADLNFSRIHLRPFSALSIKDLECRRHGGQGFIFSGNFFPQGFSERERNMHTQGKHL